MGKLKEFENHIYCCECGLVLDKKLLPMANNKDYPTLEMVNYCMRCGVEFTEIEKS